MSGINLKIYGERLAHKFSEGEMFRVYFDGEPACDKNLNDDAKFARYFKFSSYAVASGFRYWVNLASYAISLLDSRFSPLRPPLILLFLTPPDGGLNLASEASRAR